MPVGNVTDPDEFDVAQPNKNYSSFFGVAGASLSMILSAFGAEYGTWKAGATISTAGTFKPEFIVKSLLPVVMAGILAIYGLVCSVLIANDLGAASDGYTMFQGYAHFGAGLIVGMTGLSAGYALGLVGEAGVRGCVMEPKLFTGMVLMLIFCEVLGLYGLIVGLILSTKV